MRRDRAIRVPPPLRGARVSLRARPLGTRIATGGTMPARFIDSATLAFGLVSIPVKIYSTSEPSHELHFHMVHEGCGERLHQQYVCPAHGVVERDRIIKGYELTKGNFVELSKQELKALGAVASDDSRSTSSSRPRRSTRCCSSAATTSGPASPARARFSCFATPSPTPSWRGVPARIELDPPLDLPVAARPRVAARRRPCTGNASVGRRVATSSHRLRGTTGPRGITLACARWADGPPALARRTARAGCRGDGHPEPPAAAANSYP